MLICQLTHIYAKIYIYTVYMLRIINRLIWKYNTKNSPVSLAWLCSYSPVYTNHSYNFFPLVFSSLKQTQNTNFCKSSLTLALFLILFFHCLNVSGTMAWALRLCVPESVEFARHSLWYNFDSSKFLGNILAYNDRFNDWHSDLILDFILGRHSNSISICSVRFSFHHSRSAVVAVARNKRQAFARDVLGWWWWQKWRNRVQ